MLLGQSKEFLERAKYTKKGKYFDPAFPASTNSIIGYSCDPKAIQEAYHIIWVRPE